MNKKIRDIIYNKYGGLCAYTGKPLGNDWQIDHVKSKNLFPKVLVKEGFFKCVKTGDVLSTEDFKTQTASLEDKETFRKYLSYKFIAPTYKPHADCNKIENLVPAIKIINHYKRELDLEGFRWYMLNMHIRLGKLPKKTAVHETQKRKEYVYKVASLFDIGIEKPFSGVFYFETL